MNPRSRCSVSLLVVLLLAGCGKVPVVEVPSGDPESPTTPLPPNTLRMSLPPALRKSGARVAVSRLHETRPVRESVTAVPTGTQEFDVHGEEGELLAVSVLDAEDQWVESVLVQAASAGEVTQAEPPRTLQVPQDYATIQAAVDAARAGDTVRVRSGTYYETVRLKSGIRLLGSGAAWTILDGAGGPVKLVDFSGSTDVVIAGFTFQNVGTGNVCDNQDVMTCGGKWYSAAVYADGSDFSGQDPTSGLVMHNIFRNNSIGALLYFHARAVVRNNLFVSNTHGFVANHFQDVALVANNVFWKNTQEAIVNQAAYLDIINNVVAHSQVGVRYAYIQTGRIRCNAFFENDAAGTDVHNEPPRFELGKEGNIQVDPLFVAAEDNRFQLAEDSPLRGTGCFDGEELDERVRRDIGAYGGPLGNWQ